MKGRGIIGAVLPLMALIAFSGCTKKIYVPVESRQVMTDSVRVAAIRRDSVWLRDSVFVAVRGDTVIKESYRWRTRDRIMTDTVYRARHDTVKVTVVKEIPVVKAEKSNIFRRVVDRLCGILAAAGIVAVVVGQRIFPVGGDDVRSIVLSLQNETRPTAQSNSPRSADRQLRH